MSMDTLAHVIAIGIIVKWTVAGLATAGLAVILLWSYCCELPPPRKKQWKKCGSCGKWTEKK